MKKLFAFLMLVAVASAQQYNIPAARVVGWSAGVTNGVVGGIPTNRTTIIDISLAPYNADKTGVTSCDSALASAISAASSGSIIYFPAGIYRCNSPTNVTKSNITFRGDGTGLYGAPKTEIRPSQIYGWWFGSDAAWTTSGVSTTVTSGQNKGSTALTVSSATGFSIGDMALFRVPEDATIPTLDVKAFGYSRRWPVLITNIVGSVITISQPLPDTYGSGCQLYRETTGITIQSGVGIENLYFNCGTYASTLTAIFFNGASNNCWIKNVYINGQIGNGGVYWLESVNMEMQHSLIDGGGLGGTNKSGMLLETCANCLIEDSSLINAQPLIEVNKGSTSNVMAYCFLNNDPGSFGIDSNHGSTNSFNLYEGNVTPAFKPDGFFGGVLADTVYRNWISGLNVATQITPCSIKRFSYNENFVGNIIEEPTKNWSTSGTGYELGKPNIGNSSDNGTTVNYATTSTVDITSGVVASWTGTLTTKTSSTLGQYTMNTGQGTLIAQHKAQSLTNFVCIAKTDSTTIGTISGDLVNVDASTSAGFTLGTVGDVNGFNPGSDGFQGLDLGVGLTILQKGNAYYNISPKAIPAGESLSGNTLANSLYRTSKPAFFGTLTWPAFDTSNATVPAFTQIPAGYRYVNNAEVPTSGGGAAVTISTSGKLNL